MFYAPRRVPDAYLLSPAPSRLEQMDKMMARGGPRRPAPWSRPAGMPVQAAEPGPAQRRRSQPCWHRQLQAEYENVSNAISPFRQVDHHDPDRFIVFLVWMNYAIQKQFHWQAVLTF